MPANIASEPRYPDVVVDTVFDLIASALRARSTPLRIGISGLQGSGKSTLAARLRDATTAAGYACVVCSLDDFYLTHAERKQLAMDVHPLLATRGVPGTHDVDLLRQSLDALAAATSTEPVALPIFDKGSDDRAPAAQWQRISATPDLILLEGWCVGVPAQDDDALVQPINALERDDDSDGRWRRYVNDALREHYEPLWQQLDLLIVLLAPSFDVVVRWRDQQEQALRERGAAQAMTRDQVERFVAHYERLSRYALDALPVRADLLLRLDAKRGLIAVSPCDLA